MNQSDPSILQMMDFLRDLAAHNDRDWFQANKARYTEAQAAFNDLVARLIRQIGAFDDRVNYLSPKDCTYRIYRDVRFSVDKSPYKLHLGGFINARGRNSLHGGYYFHLEPDNKSMVAGGSWRLPTNILQVVRQTIVDREAEFQDIVENPIFSQLFPQLTFDPLKVMPRGVPKDFDHPEYLKCRNYCVCHPLTDSFFDGKDWLDEAVRLFRLMKPFMDFVNDVVDDYI